MATKSQSYLVFDQFLFGVTSRKFDLISLLPPQLCSTSLKSLNQILLLDNCSTSWVQQTSATSGISFKGRVGLSQLGNRH
jgi:hypothetical protein